MKQKLINLTSLATIQMSNAILPLVIFPYALGVVGADMYSKLVLSEALSLFLLTIVLFSFEIDGVSQVVGLNLKHDATRISFHLSSITYLRLLLFLFFSPVIVVIAILVDTQLVLPTICWLLIPLSYAVQPSWLFQGLEKNIPLAVITLISRLSILAIILTNVNTNQDYILVPLTIGSLYLLGGILSLLYVVRVYGISFVPIPLVHFKTMLWTGKEIFFGNLSVILYRDMNVIILSTVGSTAAGIAAYSMAEKLIKALQASTRPLNQLYFPHAVRISRLAGAPDSKVFVELLKLVLPQVVILMSIILTLILLYLNVRHEIAWIQRIENADYVAQLMLLMSLATVIGVSNFMFGSAGLNALGERGYFFGAIVSTGLLSIIFNILLAYAAGPTGAAIGFVLGELILILLILKRYFKH